MDITLNGEKSRIGDGLSVQALLESLGVSAGKVAVERNRAIVPRSAYAATPIREGDRIEIVRFVGGG